MIIFTHTDIIRKLAEIANECNDCDDFISEGECEHTKAEDAATIVIKAIALLEKELKS